MNLATYHAAQDNMRNFMQEADQEIRQLGKALAVANNERKREAEICNAAIELLVEHHVFPDFSTAEDAAVFRHDELVKDRTVTTRMLRKMLEAKA